MDSRAGEELLARTRTSPAASLRSGSATPAIRAPRRRRQQRKRLEYLATWLVALPKPYKPHAPGGEIDQPTRSAALSASWQGRLAERLEQALHGPLFDQSRADGLIPLSRDEDGRNLLPAPPQFLLKVGPAHPRHGNVEKQAPGLLDAIGREELFRRRERASRKTEFSQQVGQRLAHGFVVVDDRHE